MARTVRFLSVEDVLTIHENTLRHEGGMANIRDPGLLESAVTMPRQAFGGKILHQGPGAMSAAYLYHIAQNHAFHDGNKRTAVLAALVFLDLNRVGNLPAPEELERVTLAVAASELTRQELTDWFRRQIGESDAAGTE